MEAKSKPYVFVGYADHSKAYRLYDITTRKIVERRDVAFNEHQNGYAEDAPQHEEVDMLFEILNEDPAIPMEANVPDQPQNNPESGTSAQADSDTEGPLEQETEIGTSSQVDSDTEETLAQDAEFSSNDVNSATDFSLGDSIQTPIDKSTRPPIGVDAIQPLPSVVRASRIPLLKNRLQHEDSLSRAINNNEAVSDPRNVKEALSGPNAPEWTTAIASELASMEQHDVWELVERPPGANVIGCKWVFRIKYDSEGNIERYKARLVAQGYNQQFGVDYNEVFAPVVSYESVRCLLSLAATYDLEVHHLDIKTAFLHGDLEETIYMRQPPGFEKPGSNNMVCKLKRSIYGLKQSPRQWNKVLDGYLREHGFQPSLCEPCVYIRMSGEDTKPTIISAFVDDLLIFAPTTTETAQVKQLLASRFDVKDLGELKYFLGVEVVRDRKNRKIYLRQSRYIQDLLKRYRMEESNPTGTPTTPGEYLPMACELPVLSPAEEDEVQQIPYRNAVGALLHLMVATRPDIAYAVQAVSQHMTNYRDVHWKAVKRILRYLKGTSSYGLCLGGSKPHNLKFFADADWANDTFSRKSITGYFMTLGTGAFAWKCQKQEIVSSSTTEAECISLWKGSKHAEHITFFLKEIGYEQPEPVEAFQDNKSTITICEMPRPKSKFVDVKHCVIRDKIKRNVLKITYCPSKEMTADILTKGLPLPQFRALLPELGIVPEIPT